MQFTEHQLYGVYKTMLKSKSFLFASTMVISMSALAVEKTVDVLTHFSKGGNSWERTEAVVSGLESLGWKINFLPQGNCVTLLNYAQGEKRPGVFFNSDASISEQDLKGCNMRPEPGQFVSVLYSRRNAICGPKGSTVEDFVKHAESDQSVKIASSTFYPKKVITAIGNNFAHIPYQKSSAATAGMLAGDADYLFTGMTKGVLKNDQLSCFAQGSQEQLSGMKQFTEILPNFVYANLNVNYFLSGVNLSPELKDTLASDVTKMLQLPEWKEYIKSSYMIPADQLNMSESDFMQSVDNWKPYTVRATSSCRQYKVQQLLSFTLCQQRHRTVCPFCDSTVAH